MHTSFCQAWSGLVWSDDKALRQPVIDHVKAEQHSEKWCARLLLFLHPWAISFCPPKACLSLFIALQLICLVLNGAEQDLGELSRYGHTWAWLWTSGSKDWKKLGCQSTVLFCCWAELMFLLSMDKGLLLLILKKLIDQHKNSSLSHWIKPNSSLDTNNTSKREIKQKLSRTTTTHVIDNLNLVSSSS
jgi:hypothetical protein